MRKFRKLSAALFAAALCLSALPSAAADYGKGLILYYNFNTQEGSPETITDASGNNNDAAVLSEFGSITITDGAAVFSGPTSLDMGATLLLPDGLNDNITEFTYSAWINAVGSTDGVRFFDFGNRSYADAVPNGQRTNAYNSIHIEYYPSSGRMRFQDRRIADVYNRNDPKSYVEAYLADRPFNSGWALLTVTYGREEGFYVPHIYINGVENKDFSSKYTAFTRSLKDLGSLRGEANGLYIGRNRWSEDGFDVGTNPDFTGKMDEIRLYNRVLSASEVYDLYANTAPGMTTYASSAKKLLEVTSADLGGSFYSRAVTGAGITASLEIIGGPASGSISLRLTASNMTDGRHFANVILTDRAPDGEALSVCVRRLRLDPHAKDETLSLGTSISGNVSIVLWEDGTPWTTAELFE